MALPAGFPQRKKRLIKSGVFGKAAAGLVVAVLTVGAGSAAAMAATGHKPGEVAHGAAQIVEACKDKVRMDDRDKASDADVDTHRSSGERKSASPSPKSTRTTGRAPVAALLERRVRADRGTGAAIATMATRVGTATSRHPNQAPSRDSLLATGPATGSGPGPIPKQVHRHSPAFFLHIDLNASPQQARWRREEHASSHSPSRCASPR